MARTKQTARKALIQSIPRSAGIGRGKCGRGKGGKAVKRVAAKGKFLQAEHSEEQELQDFVNTQQFSLKFDDQDKCEKQAVQKQMFKCKNCQSYYTSQSSILKKSEYKQKKQNKALSDIQRQKFLQNYENVWICQFCLNHNSIPTSYEPPKAENPCLILEKVEKQKKEKQQDGKMLIFCIDISGSMDMSFEGKTRLQSVKQAILDQVNRIKFQKQKLKIGLITFGSEVNLIGDGSVFKQTILPTELYKNFDGVIKYLQKIENFCYPLQKSFKDIKIAISGLTVHGSTALGPGLLAAVQLSSRGSVGSKVILCTDGEANVGMGGNFNDDRFTFYSKMAQHAKKKKVMVNILSLKGDKCNLKQLGKLSLATGGSILKIDPKMLGTQFAKIVKQNVIGIQSRLIIKLNKIFKICNGLPEEVSKDQSTMIQDFGNFTEQTQLNFEFQILSKSEVEKIKQIDIGLFNSKKVPMQVQLFYTGRNNWKYLQIVTDWRELTQNLDDIYQGANFSLFAASVLQRASLKIKDSKFKQADSILSGYWSIVNQKFKKTQPQADLDRFAGRIKKLERILQSRIKKANDSYKMKKRENQNEKPQPSAPAPIGRGGRGRGRGRVAMRSRSRSRSRSASLMQSDSQNEVLYKQLRARQRSRSRDRERSRQKLKEKDAKKDKEKNKIMKKSQSQESQSSNQQQASSSSRSRDKPKRKQLRGDSKKSKQKDSRRGSGRAARKQR